MSSKRRIRRKERRRECLDKAPYASERLAEQQVYSLLRRSRKDPMKAKAGFLTSYRCKFCDAWHIGNKKDATSMGRFIGMLRDKGVIPSD